MDDVMLSLIRVFAPTVADKILGVLEGKKVKREDLFLVCLCILTEQNNNIARGLDELGKQVLKLNEGMNAVLHEIEVVNEGVAILLKRTNH